MTITTEKNLATEAKLALNIACKNEQSLMLLVGSGPIHFLRIDKVKESSTSDNIVYVSGRVDGEYFTTNDDPHHVVLIDLNRVLAIVVRVYGRPEDDILSELL